MSLPFSDQSIRPKKMKSASLPRGVEAVRCWCGDLCKVKEVTDFSDWLGMKFFMCANYESDTSESISAYLRPPSPPPLCMYYRWIDTEMPDWAVTEICERGRRAWASLDLEERREKAEAEEKAAQKKEWKEYCVEQRAFLDEVYRQREQAREAEMERKRERARVAKAAEEAGDGKGKYPRWTQ
uniref:GRF-type domain-containing protein n=1 Tax=Hordeum vulgare subsp. vulgare TaxID=112509 RepID=A0A8I6YL58_HORVV